MPPTSGRRGAGVGVSVGGGGEAAGAEGVGAREWPSASGWEWESPWASGGGETGEGRPSGRHPADKQQNRCDSQPSQPVHGAGFGP
jgi:hypothetical protein